MKGWIERARGAGVETYAQAGVAEEDKWSIYHPRPASQRTMLKAALTERIFFITRDGLLMQDA